MTGPLRMDAVVATELADEDAVQQIVDLCRRATAGGTSDWPDPSVAVEDGSI